MAGEAPHCVGGSIVGMYVDMLLAERQHQHQNACRQNFLDLVQKESASIFPPQYFPRDLIGTAEQAHGEGEGP